MKLVSAALGHNVYVRSRIPTERSVVYSCLHLKFLNRVRVGNRDLNDPKEQIIHTKSIHLKIVVGNHTAVGGEYRRTCSQG